MIHLKFDTNLLMIVFLNSGYNLFSLIQKIKKNSNAYDEEDLINPIIYIKQKHTKTE